MLPHEYLLLRDSEHWLWRHERDGIAAVDSHPRSRGGAGDGQRRDQTAAGPPALAADRRETSLRTAGATSEPNSSMARITLSWGSAPTLIWAIKRSLSKSSCSKRIFSTTSSGLPTRSAPRGERPASNWARRIGGQPRSRPIRFISRSRLGSTRRPPA